MKMKLMATAAVLALIAGSASAQQPEQGGTRTAQGAQQERSAPNAAPSPAQSESRSQPSGEKPGAAATQDVEKKAQQGNRENAQQRQGQTQDRDNAKSQRQGQTQDRNNATTQQRQGQSQDKKQNGQAETQDSKKRDGQAQTESKPGSGKAAAVELNSEQRTKISQTIKTQNVKRVTNVNFNINVGTVVPRSYTFYPIPASIVSVVPAYRGFLYLVVGDQMLIIHPRTHEIVAVIAV